MEIEQAVDRAEVKDLCITEYNEAKTMQMIREEGNITTLYDLYSDGDITLQRAALKAGMSESAFLETAKEIIGT